MNRPAFSAKKIILFLCLTLILLFSKESTPAHATLDLQSSCEAEWCLCEGYTPAMLEAEEAQITYDNSGNAVGPECAKWFLIWRRWNNTDREQFLRAAQAECDNRCRQKPAETDDLWAEETEQPAEAECDYTQDRDCDGIPDDKDLCPNLPGAHPGDMDCDDVPDDEDLCIGQFGTAQNCGCADTGIRAGDVLFRNGGPALASVYASSVVSKATSEGDEFNFGHAGLFAGSFVADRSYPILHKNGLEVYRTIAGKDQPELITLAQGEEVQAGDIVPDAILESDFGWGGVGISNLKNFKADNASFSGSDYYGIKAGTPRQQLSCDQRYDVVEIMADSARSRADGVTDYNLAVENCVNKISEAYQGGAEYAPWEAHREMPWYNLWKKKILTPNFMASWFTLNNLDAERRDTPIDNIDDPRVAIEGYSPIHLQIYDSQGRLTGTTPTGLEASIPSSEVWYAASGTKVVNLYKPQAGVEYQIFLTGYDTGSYQLVIGGFNFPNVGDVSKIIYPETQIQPGTTATIRFSLGNYTPTALSMQIDYENDGVINESILPTIEEGKLNIPQQNSEPYNPFDKTSPANPQFLWAVIPGILCFGVVLLILFASIFTKNKNLKWFGAISLAVLVCAICLVGAYFASRQFLNAAPSVVQEIPSFPEEPVAIPDVQESAPTMQPIFAPTSTPAVPAETPFPQELYPEPSVYNFAVCLEPCTANLSNRQSSFPEKIERIYLRFNYDWISAGSEFARVVKHNGQEWVRYQCTWSGTENGVYETSLREPAGFRSGEWTIEVYVDGLLISQNTFSIEGNYDYWDPAGTIDKCQ